MSDVVWLLFGSNSTCHLRCLDQERRRHDPRQAERNWSSRFQWANWNCELPCFESAADFEVAAVWVSAGALFDVSVDIAAPAVGYNAVGDCTVVDYIVVATVVAAVVVDIASVAVGAVHTAVACSFDTAALCRPLVAAQGTWNSMEAALHSDSEWTYRDYVWCGPDQSQVPCYSASPQEGTWSPHCRLGRRWKQMPSAAPKSRMKVVFLLIL